MEKVRIKQATKQGFIECAVGGGADIYPTHPVKLEEAAFKRMVGFAQRLRQQKLVFAA